MTYSMITTMLNGSVDGCPGSPQENNRLIGSSVGGLVCVFDTTSTKSEATLCDKQVPVAPCRWHPNENR